ncbi:MAG: mannose-1-phosphate guanylyltransferase [Planctomycetota bacterium]
MTSPTYAVIMAGGSGTRFWPVSRATKPKQLVRITGKSTMIQATVARLQPTIQPDRILVVTTAQLAAEAKRQLPMLKGDHIIAEPVGRDTAACVALAALVVQRLDPDASMILLPADAAISPADEFQRALLAAVAQAQAGGLVTFGIPPRYPSTGYGYIQLGEQLREQDGIQVNQVARFKEKPDAETARSYCDSGEFLWNSGIFIWRADVVIEQLRQHAPALIQALEPVQERWGQSDFDQVLTAAYEPLRRISIDYALLEQATDIQVLRAPFEWDDVGSWDALYEHLPVTNEGLIQRGDVLAVDCKDSMLLSEGGQLVAGVGLEGVSVIATGDAILVCGKGRSQGVKQVVEALKTNGRKELL